MVSRSAAYVSVVEPGGIPDSSRNPGTSMPPCQPAEYCPRAVPTARSSGMVTAERTFSFSERSESAEKETGSSMAVRASSCSRWFWMTSRAAPMPS
jgi:hypothetical protein